MAGEQIKAGTSKTVCRNTAKWIVVVCYGEKI